MEDANDYIIYRGTTADNLEEVGRSALALTYTDLPPTDGIYFYAVATLRVEGELESIGEVSNTLSLVSDSTAPPAPQNLSLELVSNGLKLDWEAPSNPGEPITYGIIRSEDTITSLEGQEILVDGITYTTVVDQLLKWV